MKNLLGVVLCGGESKRMGSDKGLIKKEDKTWAQHVAGKLTVLDIPVLISINERQWEDYSKLFAPAQLIKDNIDINGPLRGLLTVHQQYGSSDILMMACDLIGMDATTLRNLIEVYQSEKGAHFFVYENNGLAEPFCGIYTAAGLQEVWKKAVHHKLEQNSFQSLLAEGKTKRLKLVNESAFRNYNTMPGHHQAQHQERNHNTH